MISSRAAAWATCLIAGSGAALLAQPASALEADPTEQIRVVVPFPAGGTTDMLARVFGQRMQAAFRQPVIVENMDGSVGAENIARTSPDGYALLFHNLTFSATTTSLQFAGRAKHGLENFAPVSLAAKVPMITLASAKIEAADLKSFAALAKAAKEPMFLGSTGPGGTMNLVAEIFKKDAGIKRDRVPFRGAAPLVQELIAGRIHLGGDQLSTSLEHIRGGSMKPMATLAATRIS